MTRVALVANPLKTATFPGGPAALRERVDRAGRAAGWTPVEVLETTEEDPGRGMALQALEAGAELVLVAGGDGTIRSVATGLAGSGVPLAVLPIGTGNLLARNLHLAADLESALEDAAHGTDTELDLGVLVGDDPDAGEHVAVMAGMGFDAAMMDDTHEGLKRRVGWAAYVLSGARHLRDHGFAVDVRIDGRSWVRTRARGVLVGNVGRLQGGLELLPEAEPDSGVLDVAVLAPRHLRDWAVLAWSVLRRRPDRAGRRLQTTTGRRVEVRAGRRQPRQLDGDVVTPADRMVVEVRPGALRLRLPAGDAVVDPTPARGVLARRAAR